MRSIGISLNPYPHLDNEHIGFEVHLVPNQFVSLRIDRKPDGTLFATFRAPDTMLAVVSAGGQYLHVQPQPTEDEKEIKRRTDLVSAKVAKALKLMGISYWLATTLFDYLYQPLHGEQSSYISPAPVEVLFLFFFSSRLYSCI